MELGLMKTETGRTEAGGQLEGSAGGSFIILSLVIKFAC